MIDNSLIKLENGFEYRVVDKIKNNDVAYVYLINLVDKDDLVIRKEIQKDEECYLKGLESDDELKLALNLYIQKNN